MRSLTKSQWFVGVGAIGLAAGFSSAGSVTALTIDAASSLGSGTFEVTTDQGTTLPDGTFIWSLDSPVDILDAGGSGSTIAQVLSGSILMSSTGSISHSFVIQAGNSSTNVVVGTGLVAVGAFANPMGRASAGITITDTDGDGAMLTGNMAGGTMFEANYDGGAVFANLLAGPFGVATGFDSDAMSDEFPAGAGNFSPVAGPISQIGIDWDFNLSANDSSGGTSVFVVIPAPAAGLGLIGGLGLMGARRRR